MKSKAYAGTLVLTPENGAVLYGDAAVHCTVTYEPTPTEAPTLPEKLEVAVTFNGGLKFDRSSLQPNNSKLVLAKNGAEHKYVGAFNAYIDLSKSSSEAGYEVQLKSLEEEPSVLWKVIDSAPDISYTWDRKCIPVNDKNNYTPDTAPYSLAITAKVTSPVDKKPVKDFVIYWAGTYNSDLFGPVGGAAGGTVRGFSNGSTEVLKPIYTFMAGSGHDPVLMTQTDKTGEIRLVVVPTKTAACVGLNAISGTRGSGQFPLPAFAFYDPDPMLSPLVAPDIDLQLADGDYFDLDTSDNDYVPVQLDLSHMERGRYEFFIFNKWGGKGSGDATEVLNPVSYSLKNYENDVVSDYVDINISKAAFTSLSIEGQTGNNNIFYVMNSPEAGCITSPTNSHNYIGNVAGFGPDTTIKDRDLPGPSAKDTSGLININSIQNDFVVSVKVASAGAWVTPSEKDLVKVTLYVSGWNFGSTRKTGNEICISHSIDLTNLLAGHFTVKFDSSLLYGYGANPEDGTQLSVVYLEYYVLADAADDQMDNRIYSAYSTYNINTIA